MTKLFISHSSQDDAFVRDLRAALADHGQAGWIDSRELRGGDPLWSEIQKAIDEASAYAVVVSTDSLQSKWVGEELRYALDVRKQRGKDKFPVIPLSLNGTKLGVLEIFFGEEPVYIPVSSGAGGVETVMNAILVALGKRLPTDVDPSLQPKVEPLEELVLELTDLKFYEQDGVRRASARAQLVYEPATLGQPHVHSVQKWRLIAPIGPIKVGELRWYLEQYAIWPSGIRVIQERARRVESSLVEWGKRLHETAMPVAYTANVMQAWAKTGEHAGRRFSVHVDTALEAGAPETDVKASQEAATLLLDLPWELLQDGDNYLFQGAKPTRVRRRLPNTRVLDVPVVATPIRILLVTARPEDDSCSYIDHRASALPLVEAMHAYVGFLRQQQHQNTELAATLTVLEMSNLFALLDLVQRAGDAEATIDLATSLYSLLQMLGKPRMLERVGRVRDAAAALGDTWNHARFEAARTRIEQQEASGRLREALDGAQHLLKRVQTGGEKAYPNADYDLAMACWLLARVLNSVGGSEQALPLLDEACQHFEAVEERVPGCGAERMMSACITERGECLLDLGRLDEAAAAYEEGIRRDEKRGDERDVAVGKGNLGAVRMRQRSYEEALAAYEEARERFTKLGEPGMIAVSWHQTGRVSEEAGQPEAAEEAYRRSLVIKVQLGDVAGQANTLNQLGRLYFKSGRTDEAAAFDRQTVGKYVEIHDVAKEGVARSNLGNTLRKLRRLDEARQEIRRAIECKSQFDHVAEPWKSWGILAGIETDAGNPTAATEAKGKAIACYLAYRRDGGENHDGRGRISLAVTQSLLAGDAPTAASLLQQELPRFEASGFGGFLRALQAIAAGSRNRTLADAPDLHYTMAAEILLLIETLEKGEKAKMDNE